MLQILGAAITTIGVMFLIITGLSQAGMIPAEKTGMDTAIVSLLMATNGFLILLFGAMTRNAALSKPAADTILH